MSQSDQEDQSVVMRQSLLQTAVQPPDSGTTPRRFSEHGLVVASRLATPRRAEQWGLKTLVGRLVELTGAAATSTLTLTADLILQAQRAGAWAVWIGPGQSTFYPPDFEALGIDLAALPVVQVADTGQAARAADLLLRSGGFGLAVLDLGREPRIPMGMQTRLAALAKKHHTALVCITRQAEANTSLGPLVSLRGATERSRLAFNQFACDVRVVRDKQGGAGWRHREVCHGADGLC